MHVIVGITGGIAAYKATAIIRLLTEAGHSVKVIPTQNALRFIGATTLEALSHNTVDPDLYTDVESVKHVELGKAADLVIVAPASAAFLARFAGGLADDLLGNTLLVTGAPVLVAPAMHTEMWQNPATVHNVEVLRERGIKVLEPSTGRLTGEDTGKGRLPEPNEIVEAALGLLKPKDLLGQRVLISAGGTQEPIDPVRFIGNRSSGAQGLSLARAAKNRGAIVTLIAANLIDLPTDLDSVIPVRDSNELADSVHENLAQNDVLIMAAAVADYRVETVSTSKIKKSASGAGIDLHLIQVPDILKSACARVKSEQLETLVVGFAAETAGSVQALEELGLIKLANKGCDLLVANDVTGGAIFGAPKNNVLVLGKNGQKSKSEGTKELVAEHILDRVVQLLK